MGGRGRVREEEDVKVLRKELKVWEKAFHIEHGRRATKADIKARPAIREKYVRYTRLQVMEEQSRARETRRLEEARELEQAQREREETATMEDAPVSPPREGLPLLALDVGVAMEEFYGRSLAFYRERRVTALPPQAGDAYRGDADDLRTGEEEWMTRESDSAVPESLHGSALSPARRESVHLEEGLGLVAYDIPEDLEEFRREFNAIAGERGEGVASPRVGAKRRRGDGDGEGEGGGDNGQTALKRVKRGVEDENERDINVGEGKHARVATDVREETDVREAAIVTRMTETCETEENSSHKESEELSEERSEGFLWGSGPPVDGQRKKRKSKATENFVRLKLKSKKGFGGGGGGGGRGLRRSIAKGSKAGASSARVAGVLGSSLLEDDSNAETLLDEEEAEEELEQESGESDSMPLAAPFAHFAPLEVENAEPFAQESGDGHVTAGVEECDNYEESSECECEVERSGGREKRRNLVTFDAFPLLDRSQDTSSQLHATLKTHFGFDRFQDGQEEAITRTVCGDSTLLIIPTGGGKSLCYQLPALLAPEGTIVLVISPLLSLMRDQLKKLPPTLPGACLNSTQSHATTEQTLDRIRRGYVKVLFVSPERLQSEKLLNLWDVEKCRARNYKALPPIAFACIDEAHCISQWSHNFRPAYLRIALSLKERLAVNCILGLTATCSVAAEATILATLGVGKEAVVRRSPVRGNLALTASSELDKYKGLLRFLRAKDRRLFPAVIYCMFQKDTEMIASFLHSNGFAGKVAAYHAGMKTSTRRKIQDRFMAGKLSIVAATVAFGMGIDKADIRSVVHFGLPRSVENFVQEVGRAGRDGEPAHCHLFLAEEDFVLLYSLIHNDVVERANLKALLLKIFTPPKGCGTRRGTLERAPLRKGSFLVSLPIESTAIEFDMRREALDTVLTHVEQQCGTGVVRLLPTSKANAVLVQFLVQPEALRRSNAVIDSLLCHGSMASNGTWSVSVAAIANDFQVDERCVVEELTKLKNQGSIRLDTDEGDCFMLRVNGQPESVDALLGSLSELSISMERSKREKLFEVYRIAEMAAFPSVEHAMKRQNMEHLDKERELHHQVHEYFDAPNARVDADIPLVGNDDAFKSELEPPRILREIAVGSTEEEEIVRVIERVKRRAEEEVHERDRYLLSGLQAARILHGVGSPQRPANQWYSFPGYGRYRHYRFDHLRRLANRTLARLIGQ